MRWCNAVNISVCVGPYAAVSRFAMSKLAGVGAVLIIRVPYPTLYARIDKFETPGVVEYNKAGRF